MSKKSDERKMSLWGLPKGVFGTTGLAVADVDPVLQFGTSNTGGTTTSKTNENDRFGLNLSLEEAWIQEKKRRQTVANTPSGSEAPNVLSSPGGTQGAPADTPRSGYYNPPNTPNVIKAPGSYYNPPNTPNVIKPGSTKAVVDRWEAERKEAGDKVMFSIARTAERRRRMMESAEAVATDANLSAATTTPKGKRKLSEVTYYMANDSEGTGDLSSSNRVGGKQPYQRVVGAAAGRSLIEYAKRRAGENEEKRQAMESVIPWDYAKTRQENEEEEKRRREVSANG